MKGSLAAASLAVLLSGLCAQALTLSPITAVPYGIVTASEIPADAATCKAGLDAAAKAVVASNGDFTTVQQPTGATLAGEDYIYCFSAPDATAANIGVMTLTLYPDPNLQGKTLTQATTDAAYPQLASMMSLNLNQAQQMTATGQYAIIFYAWDLKDHTNPAPTTMKYVLIEEIVAGASKYACACGFKIVSYGNAGGNYYPKAATAAAPPTAAPGV